MSRGLKVKFKGRTMQEFARRYLTDISASGMFVRTGEPLPVGTRVDFDFRLEDDSVLVDGEGVVLWKAEESPELNLPAGMELRFDSFGPGSEARFHWLQMERRGVTVGREAPLSITATDPLAVPSRPAPPSSGNLDESRKRDTMPGRPQPELPQQAAAPGEDDLLAQAEQALEAQTTTPFLQAPGPFESAPTAEHPAEVTSRALVRAAQQQLVARQGSVALGRSSAPREQPEPQPGDSDPGRLFHEVAKTDSFLAEEQGEDLPVKRHATVLVDWEEQERKRTWKAHAAVGAVVTGVGLAVVLLITSSKTKEPQTPPPASFDRLVELSSTPDQAQVLLEGKLMGQTPLELPVGKNPRLELRHPGFLPRKLAISEGDPAWKPRGNKLILSLAVELARQQGSEPAQLTPPAAPAAAAEQPAVQTDKPRGDRPASLARRDRRQRQKAQERAQEPEKPAPVPAPELSPAAEAPAADQPPASESRTAAAPGAATAPGATEPAADKPLKVPSWAGREATSKPPAAAPKPEQKEQPPANTPAKEPPSQGPAPGEPLKKPSWIGG